MVSRLSTEQALVREALPFGGNCWQKASRPAIVGILSMPYGLWKLRIALILLNAELHFRLGHFYEQTNDLERARKHWVLARDHEPLRFRVDSALNQVIRNVAGASTARLVSSVLALAEADRSGRGVPGADVFHEHVHLTFQGNFTVANAMSEAVVELAGEPTGSLSTMTQCAARRITKGRAFAAEYQMRELETLFVMQSALIAMDTDNLSKARSLVTEARSIYVSLSDRHPVLERLDRLLEILPDKSKS
jgi:tetratricopeptide (TPR) repeat protein